MQPICNETPGRLELLNSGQGLTGAIMNDLSKLRIQHEEEAKPSSSSGWIKRIVFLLILVALAATGYYLYSGPLKPAAEVELAAVAAVYPSQANSVLTASGYVVAQRKADVASKATGRLEHLDVEEGTMVKKGQVLARLESRDVEAALNQARADLAVAKATLWESKTDVDRKKSLVDQELVSKSEYDLAEAQYKRAVASVESAEARVRSAEIEVENTFVRAPFDGTVLTKNADVGEIVAPFASGNSRGTVVSMADMDSLQVEADVSESNLERVKVRQPCEITLDAFPEKRYRGEVHMIVPTADRAKATVLTKVRFMDQDDRVLPEMSAKVTFLTEAITESQINAKPKITVNPNAVVDRGGKKVAFVFKDGTVSEVNVVTGGMVGSAVEVVQGLSSGDQVVLSPPANLKSGMKVKEKKG